MSTAENQASSLVLVEGYRPRVVESQEGDAGSLIAAIARAASDPRTDVDKIQRLFDIREQLLARTAEMQFVDAMAQFKEHCPVVSKDMENKQYKSKYTSIGNLVNTINPALGKYGLSANWEIEQTDAIKVTCVLSHIGGHKKSASLSAGPDTSGAKNPIQQVKSTITYLSLITFQTVTGIATHGANEDDDGGGGKEPQITEQQAAELKALITEGGGDLSKALRFMRVNSLMDIPAKNFDAVVKDIRAVNAAKARVKGGAK